MGSYQSSFNRGQMGNNLGRPSMNVASIMPGVSSAYRPRGRSPMAVPPRAAPVHGAPIIRGGVMVRHNAPVLMSSNYPVPVSLTYIYLYCFIFIIIALFIVIVV